jgi:LacI family transcriptional regulator
MSKPTLDEIAQRVGVSKSTVSYALSGKRKVSEEVSAEIQRAIEELNYTPGLRNNYRRQSTKIIGLFIPVLETKLSDDFFYYPVIEGVVDFINTKGYRLLLNRVTADMDKNSQLSFNAVQGLDGIILMNPSTDNDSLKFIRGEGLPFVVIGTPKEEEDIYYVDIDLVSAAYQAAHFLIHKGHEKIFIINTPKEFIQSSQRLEGFRHAYEKNGLKLRSEYLAYARVSMEEGYLICKKLLNDKLDFSAIITPNEIVARGVLDALKESRVSVPEKVSVVGMGYSKIADLSSPKITSIDFSPYAMGYEAAKMLIEVITKKRMRPSHLILPSRLIERETT